jgi:drug/metabolite transporter (DMT)-like permease
MAALGATRDSDAASGDGGVSGGSNLGVALCLGAAVTSAVAIIIIRRLSRWLHWSTLLVAHGLGQSTFAPLLAAASGVAMVAPDASVAALMAAVGLVGFCGQVLLNKGLGLATAGPASAMLTSEVLFSFVFQASALDTAVHATSVVGALCVTAAVVGMLVAQGHAKARTTTKAASDGMRLVACQEEPEAAREQELHPHPAGSAATDR